MANPGALQRFRHLRSCSRVSATNRFYAASSFKLCANEGVEKVWGFVGLADAIRGSLQAHHLIGPPQVS
jgi:hypothetical protein